MLLLYVRASERASTSLKCSDRRRPTKQTEEYVEQSRNLSLDKSSARKLTLETTDAVDNMLLFSVSRSLSLFDLLRVVHHLLVDGNKVIMTCLTKEMDGQAIQ